MDPTPRRIASYTLLEPIGHGGMAIVYRAHQESLDRTVAIKVLSEHLAASPEFMERFRREARTAANLHHPNVITVHDFGQDERGVPYLVLEFVEGATLADLMDGGLDDARIPDLLDQIAAGLDYAHGRGVIHRDVKPGNVLITADGRAILADFGLAWLLQGAHLTLTGGVIGTPEYMSPEQVAGDPIDHRCDVYALGVVLFEMLIGERPFAADTPIGVLLKHLQDVPPSVRELRPELPPAVDEVLMRALAKDPAARFPSAGALARAFRAAFTSTQHDGAPPVGRSETPAEAPVEAPDATPDEAPPDEATAGGLVCPGCGATLPAGAGICPACMYMIPLDQLPKAPAPRKLKRRQVVLNLLPYRLRWDPSGLAVARRLATEALLEASRDGWEPASIGEPYRLVEGRTITGAIVEGAILSLEQVA
jgi:eukaryotic-like serine/threonine-protein kinase